MHVAAIISSANAADSSCPSCAGQTWSGLDKLAEIGSGGTGSVQSDLVNVAQISKVNEDHQAGTSTAHICDFISKAPEQSEGILASPSDVKSSDVILNVDPQAVKYIKGAIHIDSRDFSDGSSRLKTASELSDLLGRAGISQSDSVIVYSEEPSIAAYAYLLLKYLGQKNVRLLDGGIDDWAEAGKTIADLPEQKPATLYTPLPETDLIASYSYLKGNDVQVVDARPSEEYAVGSIAGSISVPYDAVIDSRKIKRGALLSSLFTGLKKDKPVAVYSNSGIEASIVWYALKLEGYHPKFYAGDDWSANLITKDGEPGSDSSTGGLGTSAKHAGPRPPCCRV
ncbi:MAG TPA: rhodanese-like domain-containing protein [Methanotrichaceae archaeon]|nr:rhodanese-like domain-containing protein [Methanotrichaceae archaeon]